VVDVVAKVRIRFPWPAEVQTQSLPRVEAVQNLQSGLPVGVAQIRLRPVEEGEPQIQPH
jgi:hypothetical protein